MHHARPTSAILAVILLVAAARVDAQERADSVPPVPCDSLPVSSVAVTTHRPTFKGALGWWRKVARAFGLHHDTTEPALVRRFLTLDPGRACTEFRRTESERILRAQPYLADASVTTTRVGDSVAVTASTIDEVPVVGGARVRRGSLDALSLGTMNFLGAGMLVEGRWEQGHVYRDGIGARLSHTQLFGHPYVLALDGIRHPIGEEYGAAVSHPFLTDLQRLAWHVGYRTSKDFARMRRPDRVQVAEPLNRTLWDVGGVVRVGPPRRLLLIGGVVTGEHLLPQNNLFEVDTVSGLLTPTTNDIAQYQSFDQRSVASVLGVRALTYTRMRGLDALVAEQDIATGTQLATMVGTRPFSGPILQNGFASVDLYSAGRSARHFVGVRTEVESRADLGKREWQHLVASGRAAWYFTPTRTWTQEVALEGAGVWRSIIPFQLELGDRQGGVRGYARSLEAGAQRLILRVEERADLGRFQKDRAALGAGVFADAGRIWAGDAPYGTNTPVRASVGVALLAAVPVRSQRTIRAEVAVPLARAEGARPELRFTIREPARGFWTDPPRVRWARLTAVPQEIFGLP
ncbi:MAG TPA: hypothetical protein VJ867_13015 [Gemmatimonadaceae bacterium]|nr:hypothetical protein [Gemmatimonadaceae bacterium]